MKIWDISPLISNETAVFPGDTPFSKKTLMSFENKDDLHLSTIESTVHIGAHTDAPSHYDEKGKSIDEISLEPYIGPVQVIEVHCGNSPVIEPQHFIISIFQQKEFYLKQVPSRTLTLGLMTLRRYQ